MLNCFSDKLTKFPPKSVLLKRPFIIQPWNGSEENIGNLLMVSFCSSSYFLFLSTCPGRMVVVKTGMQVCDRTLS